MAGAPTATLDLALNGVAPTGSGTNAWLSMHTADPGLTGASEVPGTGGSPNYARKQTTWAAASAGVKTGSAQTFDIPPGTTVGWFGVWSAATGGTWITGGPLRNTGNTANITETYNQQGQYALTPRITADNIAVT
jgi:hypothetical protein